MVRSAVLAIGILVASLACADNSDSVFEEALHAARNDDWNGLAQAEWDAEPGEVAACGGIVMIRTDAFRAAGGFNADLIAGEEPELCLRLRRQGYRIWRLDTEGANNDVPQFR